MVVFRRVIIRPFVVAYKRIDYSTNLFAHEDIVRRDTVATVLYAGRGVMLDSRLRSRLSMYTI